MPRWPHTLPTASTPSFEIVVSRHLHVRQITKPASGNVGRHPRQHLPLTTASTFLDACLRQASTLRRHSPDLTPHTSLPITGLSYVHLLPFYILYYHHLRSKIGSYARRLARSYAAAFSLI